MSFFGDIYCFFGISTDISSVCKEVYGAICARVPVILPAILLPIKSPACFLICFLEAVSSLADCLA